MQILPSGRKRIMEAQFPQGVGESNDWGVDELGPSNEYPLEEVPSIPSQTEIPDKSQEVPEEKSDGKPDLNEYLFKKLETFNYPPRRLEDFSEEFIEEDIYPDGFKEIKVTIPDRYYGTKKRLSDSDLQDIVNEIQNNFELALTKATRKDKKILMDFTSQAKIKQEEGEKEQEGMAQDDLDEIFGPKKGPKKDRKTAQTQREMIKEGRSRLWLLLTSLFPTENLND